jgi:glycosyltransferase involved in cell wall biosynthesis
LVLNYPNYEVIVVDNAPSTSETHDYIHTEYKDNDMVRYVREDQAGLSWARNCGIRHAHGEYVAFTDDDAFADPYWLAYLMQNFFDTKEVACVTGLALPFELEHEAQIWFEQFGGLGNGFKRQVFDMDENTGDHALYPYTVAQYGAGVNMIFRTDILRKLNGFIVQINQADDISMFVKIITNGYKIAYEPSGFVYHKHRADYEGLRRQIYNYGIGLSHFIIHMIVSDWKWLFRVAPRIPVAILHLLSTKSYKNENKESGYPAELTWLERKGMLAGPIKYWQYARKIRGLHSAVEQESY